MFLLHNSLHIIWKGKVQCNIYINKHKIWNHLIYSKNIYVLILLPLGTLGATFAEYVKVLTPSAEIHSWCQMMKYMLIVITATTWWKYSSTSHHHHMRKFVPAHGRSCHNEKKYSSFIVVIVTMWWNTHSLSHHHHHLIT